MKKNNLERLGSKMHRYILFISAIILLNGCSGGSNIKDFYAYEKQPLVKADVMPTKSQLSRNRARVVVLDIDDSTVDLARESNLGVVLRQKIEGLLAEGGVDVIDRKLAATLKKEIMLAELKGKHDYKGPEVADYGVIGNVITVNFSSSYIKASSWVDKKGKSHYSPARCRFSVQFEGHLKVHALPSLRLIDTIKINETESRSQEVTGYSSRCQNYDKNALKSFVAQTAIKAVRDSKVELKNNFPPRGYITEARINDDDNIFKTTMGRLAGIKEGQTVNVFQFFNNENALTGEINIEESKLVSAIVSNNMGDSYSWVIVEDAEKAKRIRLGDEVKVHFEDGWIDAIKKVF